MARENNGKVGIEDQLARTFIARQPVFDGNKRVFAYELLFRSGETNSFSSIDGTTATARVMLNGLMVFGLGALTGGKPVLVNVDQHILARDFLELFTPEQLIVEILEDVEPTAEVIHNCRHLKEAGFRLALDDVVDGERFDMFEGLADIVKVDFMAADEEMQAEIATRLLPQGVRLLAEKVETHEEVSRALCHGYSYFQGYFFAKPEVLSKKDVEPNKLSSLHLMRELNQSKLDIPKLESVLKSDVGLSYRLLRYINSAQFALRTKVSSLNHALRLLGPQNVRKWAMLISLTSLVGNKPMELLTLGLARARFCESLGDAAGLADYRDDLFLTGMFSVLDGIVDMPRSQLLSELSLSAHIVDALLYGRGPLGEVMRAVLAFEQGQWEQVEQLASCLRIERSGLTKAYLESLAWARESMPPLG